MVQLLLAEDLLQSCSRGSDHLAEEEAEVEAPLERSSTDWSIKAEESRSITRPVACSSILLAYSPKRHCLAQAIHSYPPFTVNLTQIQLTSHRLSLSLSPSQSPRPLSVPSPSPFINSTFIDSVLTDLSGPDSERRALIRSRRSLLSLVPLERWRARTYFTGFKTIKLVKGASGREENLSSSLRCKAIAFFNEENSEIEMLWREIELSLASDFFLEENEPTGSTSDPTNQALLTTDSF
ncbi:uncharacterized protein LOC110655177 [Hevea brasiliensis]|uniref:uncharacterized protein LOC110655177 n=1 Tax=Hevea brasiliensis TaxID=3981 RepID=UPI0025D063E6|nr:uncharacterized protein LOC110655177 [Hevea brasiliensis]